MKKKNTVVKQNEYIENTKNLKKANDVTDYYDKS